MISLQPAFAADKQSEDKDTIIASAVDLADKVRPYIDYKDGKAILKHVTAKEIGITQQELNDIRKGLAMVDLKKSDQSSDGQMHTDFSVDSNGYGLYVRLSVNDIKNGLIVGVLAGGILALGGIFTQSIAEAAAGVVVGVITNIVWMEADMLPTTIYNSK